MLRYQIFTLASVDYFEVGMLEFSTQQAYRVLATLQCTVICNQKKKNNIRLQRIYMTLRNDKIHLNLWKRWNYVKIGNE